MSYCSSLTDTRTGETVVRKSGLQSPSRRARLDLDAPCVQRGVEFLNGARRSARHVHLSRTRQQLLLHGSGTERRGLGV